MRSTLCNRDPEDPRRRQGKEGIVLRWRTVESLGTASSKAPRSDLCSGPSLLLLGRKGLKLQEGKEKGRRDKEGKEEEDEESKDGKA